ncbi:MAG: peptide ABC transporter substrate-binding protein [Chloroflexota bacterium]
MNKHDPSPTRVRLRAANAVTYLAAVCSLLFSVVPANASALEAPPQQSACRKLGDYSVCGRFIDEWSKQDSDQASLYVNGLPITAQRPEISLTDGKTYQTQWFERARYEAHPENKAPYDLLLGRLGGSLAEGRGIVDPYTHEVRSRSDAAFVGIDKPQDADGIARVWFRETRHSVSGKILEYWNRYGGLAQFGFPLSEQFQEISDTDNKTYMVQYFERNRFELHPESQPPYEVQLGLLGVQQYRITPVAGDKLPLAPPPGVKSSKDTLVIGVGDEPQTLSPYYADANGIEVGSSMLYQSLVDSDSKGDYFGELAWYAPTIENGGARFVGSGEDRHLQVKYKMRPDMKWSDGVEITSNDVVFNYKTNRDPDFYYDSSDEKLYNIDNPDKYTVISNFMSYAQARDLYNSTTDKQHFSYLKHYIDGKMPVTDPWYAVVTNVLYPEHIMSQIPFLKREELGYYSDPTLLVTSGPFKVDRWDQDQQLVLVPNPYYSLTAPPLLKKVVYRFITDRDTRIAQLKSGDVDVLFGSTFPAPDAQFKQLEQAGMKAENAPAPNWEHLDLNLDQPYFKDKAVRQAIAYAINRQKIVDDVSFGAWRVTDTMVPPKYWTSVQHPDFPEEWKAKFPLHTYPYDPVRANRMLDQAGWVQGPDGIRAKGGVRLSFRYDTTNAPVRKLVQALVQTDLKAVGIEARVAQQNSDDFFDSASTGDFDMAEYAWIQNDPYSAGDTFDSANIPTLENDFVGSNRPRYRNPHFDELSRIASGELDSAKQYPLQAELQAIYSEDLPAISLFARTIVQIHKPNLMNWDPSFSYSALSKIAAIYFK